jgi:hypothetical protein
VSVVATGIDASAANKAEPPVARRSMGAPLTLTPAQQPEAPRAAAPVYARAAPAPVMEDRTAFEEEVDPRRRCRLRRRRLARRHGCRRSVDRR